MDEEKISGLDVEKVCLLCSLPLTRAGLTNAIEVRVLAAFGEVRDYKVYFYALIR